MDILEPKNIINKEFDIELFGANILATRDQLGEDGTYDDVAENIGIESIRYPGSSLTNITLILPILTTVRLSI